MKSILKWLENLETAIVTVALICMTITIFLQVFFRFSAGIDFWLEDKGVDAESFLRSISGWFFITSLSILTWTEEAARYFMVWVVFVGAAIGARLSVHVGIEAFVNLLPARLTRASYILSGIISLVFSLIVCYYGLQLVDEIRGYSQTSPAIEIPMIWVYAAAPVGAFLMAVHFMQAAVEKYINYTPAGKEC